MFGIGIYFLAFFALVIVVAVIGFWMTRRAARKNPSAKEESEEFLSEETVGNVHNLNDQFNRARYMDKDGN